MDTVHITQEKEHFDFLTYALEMFRKSNEAAAQASTLKINSHHCGIRCFFGKCPIPKWQSEKFRAEEKITHCAITEDYIKDKDFLSALIQLTWFLTKSTLPDR